MEGGSNCLWGMAICPYPAKALCDLQTHQKELAIYFWRTSQIIQRKFYWWDCTSWTEWRAEVSLDKGDDTTLCKKIRSATYNPDLKEYVSHQNKEWRGRTLGNEGNLACWVILFLTSFISHSPQRQKFFLLQLGTHIRASPCNCTIPYYAKNFYIFTFHVYFYSSVAWNILQKSQLLSQLHLTCVTLQSNRAVFFRGYDPTIFPWYIFLNSFLCNLEEFINSLNNLQRLWHLLLGIWCVVRSIHLIAKCNIMWLLLASAVEMCTFWTIRKMTMSTLLSIASSLAPLQPFWPLVASSGKWVCRENLIQWPLNQRKLIDLIFIHDSGKSLQWLQ